MSIFEKELMGEIIECYMSPWITNIIYLPGSYLEFSTLLGREGENSASCLWCFAINDIRSFYV